MEDANGDTGDHTEKNGVLKGYRCKKLLVINYGLSGQKG